MAVQGVPSPLALRVIAHDKTIGKLAALRLAFLHPPGPARRLRVCMCQLLWLLLRCMVWGQPWPQNAGNCMMGLSNFHSPKLQHTAALGRWPGQCVLITNCHHDCMAWWALDCQRAALPAPRWPFQRPGMAAQRRRGQLAGGSCAAQLSCSTYAAGACRQQG